MAYREVGSIQVHPGICLRVAGLHVHEAEVRGGGVPCYDPLLFSVQKGVTDLAPSLVLDVLSGHWGAGMTVPDSSVLVQARDLDG